MAAGDFTIYSANKAKLNPEDLLSATLKMVLLTSAYVPDSSASGHDTYADLTNELSSGHGYTNGGLTLATLAVNAITNGWRFNTANPSWTASGTGIPAWRFAAMYASGSLWGLTNPLIGYFLGDSLPQDIPLTPAGTPLTIICPSAGWFDVV